MNVVIITVVIFAVAGVLYFLILMGATNVARSVEPLLPKNDFSLDQGLRLNWAGMIFKVFLLVASIGFALVGSLKAVEQQPALYLLVAFLLSVELYIITEGIRQSIAFWKYYHRDKNRKVILGEGDLIIDGNSFPKKTIQSITAFENKTSVRDFRMTLGHSVIKFSSGEEIRLFNLLIDGVVIKEHFQIANYKKEQSFFTQIPD